MVYVVGVHGIGQQQSGRQQMLQAWGPALADGVERAAGRDLPKPVLDLAYYGDLFLAATATKGAASTSSDGLELDDDLLDLLGDIEEEIVDQEPPEAATKGFKELPLPVARLAAWLDDRFGAVGRLLFFGDLAQVSRYQRDSDLASSVRERVDEAVGAQAKVLIGHSLGSIVAYEYLCLKADHGVEMLITLGSPLALRSIQSGLRTLGPDGSPIYPPGVMRWVNVYDPGDPVSCGGGLSTTWPTVADELADNGTDPHAASRYLGKAQTGRAVVAALQS